MADLGKTEGVTSESLRERAYKYAESNAILSDASTRQAELNAVWNYAHDLEQRIAQAQRKVTELEQQATIERYERAEREIMSQDD